MRKVITYLILVFVAKNSFAQVTINNKIVLIGNNDSSRHVEGLSIPTDTSSISNAEAIMKGTLHLYDISSINADTINLSRAIAIPNLKKGMKINFLHIGLNTGIVFVKLPLHSPIKIVKDFNKNLNPGDLKDSMLVSLIYNGTYFQLQNPLVKKCPTGFIELNAKTCIQPVESSTGVNFYTAGANCQNLGARLCTWGEWYYACSNSGVFGITDMTNNFEFVDTSTNSPGSVGTMGNGTCTTTSATTAGSSNRVYRCCFTK